MNGTGQGISTAPTLIVPELVSRRNAFNATRFGRRFVVTDQTPNAPVTAQVGFLATTPTFLLRQVLSTRKIIFRSFSISLLANAGGAALRVIVALDTADRFSAGGTAVTPQNLNEESATASALTSFLVNPTATAAGAGTRYITHIGTPTTAGVNLLVDYSDGVFLGTTGAILIYCFVTVGTAPSIFYTCEFEEIP